MKKVLFLNLTAFSQTGGLEKFNRCFLKALYELEADSNTATKSYSLYDTESNTMYYPSSQYKGFGKSRISFVINSWIAGLKSDVIILGHINLALVGVLIKFFAPSKKLILICHGVEVWSHVSSIKKYLLKKVDKLLAVSNYTKQKLINTHNIAANKITIFHNAIDPYFKTPQTFNKNKDLLARYQFKETDFVLYTLCRLSSKEQYKGYDAVMFALPKLLAKYPNIKYLIAGKYDSEEKDRLETLSQDLGIASNIIFSGFIDDTEVIDHYLLGDVYVMPSKGEGFGIVFIEAMACGCKAIAGNTDGSVDALVNGELGLLVDPIDIAAIANAIESVYLQQNRTDIEEAKSLQDKVMNHFGFDAYKNRLKDLLPTI